MNYLMNLINQDYHNIQILEEYKKQSLSEDLPKYGILYQDGDRFEYILKDKRDLQDSVKEMNGKKTEFFLE